MDEAIKEKTLTLSEKQITEMTQLKSHFPFRIVYGAINNAGDFIIGASFDMRQPNKLVRQGYTVYKC